MKIKKILFCLGAVFLHALLPVLAHDSHKGLQHWEIPSMDPDRIILTFYGDPATCRAVTWRTDKSVTKAVAQIAEAKVNSSFTSDIITVLSLIHI